MSAPRRTSPAAIVHQPAAQFYDRFVQGIKQRIRTAQIKAALADQRVFFPNHHLCNYRCAC